MKKPKQTEATGDLSGITFEGQALESYLHTEADKKKTKQIIKVAKATEKIPLYKKPIKSSNGIVKKKKKKNKPGKVRHATRNEVKMENMKRAAAKETTNIRKVLSVLFSGTPVTVDDVVEATGVQKTTIATIVSKAVRNGQLGGFNDFSSITDPTRIGSPKTHAWEGAVMDMDLIHDKYKKIERELKEITKKRKLDPNYSRGQHMPKNPKTVKAETPVKPVEAVAVPVTVKAEPKVKRGTPDKLVNKSSIPWAEMGMFVEACKDRGIGILLTIDTSGQGLKINEK